MVWGLTWGLKWGINWGLTWCLTWGLTWDLTWGLPWGLTWGITWGLTWGQKCILTSLLLEPQQSELLSGVNQAGLTPTKDNVSNEQWTLGWSEIKLFFKSKKSQADYASNQKVKLMEVFLLLFSDSFVLFYPLPRMFLTFSLRYFYFHWISQIFHLLPSLLYLL